MAKLEHTPELEMHDLALGLGLPRTHPVWLCVADGLGGSGSDRVVWGCLVAGEKRSRVLILEVRIAGHVGVYAIMSEECRRVISV
jgi:hypothetical protein